METTEETTKSIALKELSNAETKQIKTPRGLYGFFLSPYSVIRLLLVTWKIFLTLNYNLLYFTLLVLSCTLSVNTTNNITKIAENCLDGLQSYWDHLHQKKF